MKIATMGCAALSIAVLVSSYAEARVICVPINCTKVARDGGNNPTGVPNPKDGIGDSVGSHNSGTPESGFRAGDESSIAFYVFDLPELNGQTILSVKLESTLASNTDVQTRTPNFNLDAVALRIDPTDPHVQYNDFEDAVAALGTSQVIGDDLATPSSTVGASLPTITDGNFLSYLSGSYVDNGKLFIAMVPDILPTTNDLEGAYGVNAPHPFFSGAGEMVLKITVADVPEPATALLAVMAAGSVLSLRRRRR